MLAALTESDYQNGTLSRPETLGELPVGARAVVERLTHERPLARRLMEMGLLPGTAVRVVRRAPLGDPMEIELRCYRLSIRREDATRVAVRDVEDAR